MHHASVRVASSYGPCDHFVDLEYWTREQYRHAGLRASANKLIICMHTSKSLPINHGRVLVYAIPASLFRASAYSGCPERYEKELHHERSASRQVKIIFSRAGNHAH